MRHQIAQGPTTFEPLSSLAYRNNQACHVDSDIWTIFHTDVHYLRCEPHLRTRQHHGPPIHRLSSRRLYNLPPPNSIDCLSNVYCLLLSFPKSVFHRRLLSHASALGAGNKNAYPGTYRHQICECAIIPIRHANRPNASLSAYLVGANNSICVPKNNASSMTIDSILNLPSLMMSTEHDKRGCLRPPIDAVTVNKRLLGPRILHEMKFGTIPYLDSFCRRHAFF